MQETLEGRLKWERTPQGIFVSIPIRRGPSTAGYALLILIWLAIASVHYWHMLSSQHADSSQYQLEMAAIAIYVFGFFLFVGWLAWTTTGETVVLLDGNELKIQKRALGIELATRRHRNSDIRNIRFVRPKQFWALRSDTDPSTSKIQFVTAHGFDSFAKGIGESEAAALIERMMEIYPFPKSGETYRSAAVL
jgi:hypothetical protein